MERHVSSGKPWIVPFLINAIVSVAYLLITSILFVQRKQPDPIGIGILQWVCIAIHIIILIITFSILALKSPRVKHIGKSILYSALGLLTPLTIYLLLSEPIWKVLWNLRDN